MAKRSRIRRPLVILMALAGPAACTPSVTQQQPKTYHVEVRDFPPSGKSEYEQESDRANCKNAHSQDAVAYAHCLMALGYRAELAMAPEVVLYSTSNPGVPYPSGPVAPLPNAVAQTIYPPSQEITPKSPGQASGIVAQFKNFVDVNQGLILLAAHPTGTIDSTNSIATSNTVVDNINWHGPSGRAYITILTFRISYSSQSSIDSLSMDFEEVNNPFPPAFVASEVAKQAILHYASDRMSNSLGKLIVKTINSNSSTKGALIEFLRLSVNGVES